MLGTRTVTLAGALSFAAAALLAQDIVQVAPGTRIRVTEATGAGQLVGTLLAVDDKTLTLRASGQTGDRVLRRQDITSVAVSAGHGSRRRGALVGAAIGAGVGAAIGLLAGSDKEGLVQFSAGEKAVGAAILLASIGGLVGVALPPGERWRELPLSRIGLSFAPIRERGVAVSLTFVF